MGCGYKILSGVLLLSVTLLHFSCTTPGGEPGDRLPGAAGQSDLDWDDLTSSKHLYYQPARRPDNITAASLTAHLPKNLQQRPDLAELAMRAGISSPRFYADGVTGKRRYALHYLTTPERLRNEEHRLYWVMVKTLSEKFGCFMRGQFRWRGHTAFNCRDGRMVVIQEAKDKNWWRFSVRQYDRAGREIVVEKRRVVLRRDPQHLPKVLKTYLAGLESARK